MSAVPDPVSIAIALQYDADSGGAPRVVAQGRGESAAHLLRLAQEHGIAVREDRVLAELLGRCEPGAQIPPELYEAVARLLAWLRGVDHELGERRRAST